MYLPKAEITEEDDVKENEEEKKNSEEISAFKEAMRNELQE